MKFEDFLMEKNDEQHKKLHLEEEVLELQAELEDQHKVNTALQWALHGSPVCHPCRSSSLPLQIQVLLAEVASVEKEIISLERKVAELKVCHEEERKQNKLLKTFHKQHYYCQQLGQQKHHLWGSEKEKERRNLEQIAETSFSSREFRSRRWKKEREALEFPRILRKSNDDVENSINEQKQKQRFTGHGSCTQNPNKLSENLIRCLIGIFLKLDQSRDQLDYEGSATLPKLSLSCINSKTSFNCKAPTSFVDEDNRVLDPYGLLHDPDSTVKDRGPYKNFIQLTRCSLDMDRLSECFPAIRRLRNLMNKLSTVELSFSTYKQKLAFWINIYNACIMHGFLQYGLPLTTEKHFVLMNKAVLNVGRIVLNALAIEHFILRHPYASKFDSMDENEMLLRHAYGLGFPEPNVTFALCRGSWSSPALRVYTAEEVVNELERAKVEYLEASLGVTNKKKIVIPKLLHWHMQDFADNLESLLEWIYSQLPQSGPVKRLIVECLNRETKPQITKNVEIQRYESEFRYLLPM